VRGKMHARVQVEALVHGGIPHARQRTRKLGLGGLAALLDRLERASLRKSDHRERPDRRIVNTEIGPS
jgi:hypothetical protein